MSGVLGIFPHPAACAQAIQHLRRQGFRDLIAYSPVPDHEIEAALERPMSPVWVFTLTGAIIGCVAGFTLTIGTSIAWPLITSGKPIVSLPTFVVIAFETTILFGALGNLLGFLLRARLPSRGAERQYDPRFSEDRFGLLIRCDARQAQTATDILRSAGAEEVRLETA
jgi:molybdopterin-containing oxidoreductase family membrane subunit